MPNHSARAIANEFIKMANDRGRPLSHMQLQKLVYIAHGWNLAINAEPLVDEPPRAWEYGPVYETLYRPLSIYGASPITHRIRPATGDFSNKDVDPISANLSDEERAVISRVYEDYGDYAAFQLSALTHAKGTPWFNTYHDRGRNAAIEDGSIREHFVQIAQGKRPS